MLLLGLAGAELKSAYGLEPLLTGADTYGRGGAYLAADENNSYVFQNYAFLNKRVTPRVSLTAFKLISEIDYLSASYSQDNFSLGFLTIQEAGGFVRDSQNNLLGGRIGYNDTTLYGAYAFQFENFNLGARAKYYSKYFSEVDTSAWGLALDLAGYYEYNRYWAFGAALDNVIGTTLQWTDDLREQFPLALGVGGRFRAFGPDGFWQEWDWLRNQTDFYADLRLEERNSLFKTGVEIWPHEMIALRAGLAQYNSVQDDEDTRAWKFTAGAGVNWNGIYFDYAFNPGDDIAETITHFFTLSYRFAAEKPATPELEVIPEPVVSRAAPLRYKVFTDIDGYSAAEQYVMEDLGYLGLMIGYPGALFRPEQLLTRKELMLILARLAEREDIAPDRAFLNFKDITENISLETADAVLKTSERGYIRGYTDGSVRPEIPVRRSEAAAAIARYYGIDGGVLSGADLYSDVAVKHWAYKDINQTKQHALTLGVGRDLFQPEQPMKRLDVARILSRLSFVQTLREDLPDIVGLPRTGNVTEEHGAEAAPVAPAVDDITPSEEAQIESWYYEEQEGQLEERAEEYETGSSAAPETTEITDGTSSWEDNYLTQPAVPPDNNDAEIIEDEDGWTIDYEY
ncbi:MAG: S-layer homology domain-containing protein [Candidatus Margulisbacteria bacterium]|nr:S-layer homology domain-containing protein [Candidatus Margulisiibacteriota bacterium]